MSDYDRFCEHGAYLGRNCEHCERLREHYDKHLDDRVAWQAEIKRLRAALERIVNEPWNAGKGGWAQKIAREALNKGEDK